MLIDRGNPYAAGAPAQLVLDWDDFRFALSDTNRAALGRRAGWSVLAYLAADNDLARWIFDDLLEMKSVGSSPQLHLLALFDGPLLADSFIARLNADGPLGADLVMRFNELRTNDPALLNQVLQLAQAFPGERRIVIMGGHGAGWRGALLDQNAGLRYRHEPGRLQLPGPGADCDAELRRAQVAAQDALNQAIEQQAGGPPPGPVEVLAFDACYMGNLEAIAGLGSVARWLVLSEDQWPGEGFDYRTLLRTLQAEPDIATDTLLRRWVAGAEAAWRGRERDAPVTLAAIDTRRLPALAEAFVRLAQSLDAGNPALMRLLHDALAASWRSPATGMADLTGLARQLLAREVPAAVAETANALLARIDDALVARCGGGTAASTNGLSIYAPLPEHFDTDYIRLANELPHGLGVWAWTLGGCYLEVLGRDAPAHPLIAALQATMQAAKRPR